MAENEEKQGVRATGTGGSDSAASTEQEEKVEFTDTQDEGADGKTADGGAEKPAESGKDGDDGKAGSGTDDGRNRQRDAEEARKRREAKLEREKAKSREEGEAAGIIDALDGVNPYTGKPMKDAEDVKAYKAMKAIKARGGDPLTEYAGEVADEQRAARKAQEEAQKKDEWYNQDGTAFEASHPGMTVAQLLKDADFVEYAGKALGEEPLNDIYSRYTRLTARMQAAADTKAAQKLANAQSGSASAGSVGAGTPPEAVTKKEFARMTFDERVKLKRENPALYNQLKG